MTTEKERRTVWATVKSKAQVEDGWKLELDIPEFKSQFPTLCTRVKPEVAALLVPGQTASLVLVQQKLKKDKDGSYPSHYYWGLEGIASPDTIPEAPAAPVAPQPRDGNSLSIESQTAYKGAVALAAAGLRASSVTPTQVQERLLQWTLWGMEAIQQAKRHTRQEVPHTGEAPGSQGTEASSPPSGLAPAPSTSPSPAPKPETGASPPGASPTLPKFADHGAVMDWAYRTWKLYPSDIQKELFRRKLEMPAKPDEAALLLMEIYGPPKEAKP